MYGDLQWRTYGELWRTTEKFGEVEFLKMLAPKRSVDIKGKNRDIIGYNGISALLGGLKCSTHRDQWISQGYIRIFCFKITHEQFDILN